MKLVKTLGLAAVAAMAVMAFVGVTSASADPTHLQLCEKAELECQSPVGGGGSVEIHAETLAAEPPKLVTSLGTVECEHSLAILTLLNELTTLQIGHLLDLKFFGNCKLGKTACEVTVKPLGLLSFTKIGALEASAKSTGGTEATVVCGGIINCTYGGEPLVKVHSSGEGHLLLLAKETVLTNTKGLFCPSSSKWIATYHAVNLDEPLSLKLGLYIES